MGGIVGKAANEAVEKLYSWAHSGVNQMEYQGSNGN
jgi:hypothetical protein